MPKEQPKGIDIETALSILAERNKASLGSNDTTTATTRNEGNDMNISDNEQKNNNDNDPNIMEMTRTGACGCCFSNNNNGRTIVPENLKTMGQTIDLNNTNNNSDSNEEKFKQQQEQQEKIQKERAQRQEEIKKQLHSMSNKELLQAVLNAQEQRVATYKEYERGLMIVLESGNMTTYPDTCSKATASFSVLSDTIKEIQSIFHPPKKSNTNDTNQNQSRQRQPRPDLATLIQQLQSLEKEKLHLTAAHHLERIRERNEREQQQMQQQQQCNNNDNTNTGDLRIQKLLQQGVASLQQKINKIIEDINDVLDDIRCALLEEEEEDE